MKRTVLLLILTFLVFVNISAGKRDTDTTEYKYNSAVLFQAKGPVKKIKIKSRDPFKHFCSAKFGSDGKFDDPMGMVYDADGYFSYFRIGGESGFLSVNESGEAKYDESRRLTGFKLDAKAKGFLDFSADYSFKYSDEGILTQKTMDYAHKGKKGRFVYDYSDYSFDSQGSWVKRNVKLSDYDSEGEKKSETDFTETRQIEYYLPENISKK